MTPPQPVYTQQPAVIPTSQPKPAAQASQPPPSYTPLSAQNINIEELRRQQEELDRKTAELNRKEQALRNAEQGINGISGPIKNFPPLPSWFPLKPCFYQDISVEIPLDFQKWVRILFYLWMCKFILKLETKTSFNCLIFSPWIYAVFEHYCSIGCIHSDKQRK